MISSRRARNGRLHRSSTSVRFDRENVIKAIGGGDMSADNAVVHPAAPEWMQLPESDDAEA